MPPKNKEARPRLSAPQSPNCAVVTIDGKNYYLGKYDSPNRSGNMLA